MNAFRKGLLIALLLPASAGILLAAPSMAADIVTNVAPPEARAESPPPPRAGFAWAPGHWEWNDRFYVWASGTWIPEHRGTWIPDQWEQTGTQWHYLRGHWQH
jgi:hypothetical protein